MKSNGTETTIPTGKPNIFSEFKIGISIVRMFHNLFANP